MRAPALLAAAAATMAVGGSANGGAAPDPRHAVVRFDGFAPLVGPELAGREVLWIAGDAPRLVTVRRAAPRVLWRAPRVRAPTDFDAAPGWSRRVVQQLGALAGSRRRVAFLHSAVLVLEPPCARSVPPCLGVPTQLVPFLGEVWIGSPRGPFRRLEARGAPSCSGRRIVTSLDVSAATVAFADAPACMLDSGARRERVVVAMPRGRRIVAAHAGRARIENVGIAWPYVAWSELHPAAAPAVVVFDLRARRVARRVPLGSRVPAALDVDATGRVVVLLERVGGCVPGYDVAIAGARERRLRSLSVRAAAADVRLVGGRLVVPRANGCRADRLELAVARVGGRATAHRVPPGWRLGGFDLDADRLAYAATTDFPVRDPHLRRRTNIYVVPLAR